MEKDPNAHLDLGYSRPPRFVKGPPPQPVDLNRLRSYHLGELPEVDAANIDYLIALFQEWREASGKVLVDLAKEMRFDETQESDVSNTADSVSKNTSADPSTQENTANDRDLSRERPFLSEAAPHPLDISLETKGRPAFVVPPSLALSNSASTEGRALTFEVAAEQCIWEPLQPSTLQGCKSQISLVLTNRGSLAITIQGFLFDSAEHALEVIWRDSALNERARSATSNPYLTQLELSATPPSPPQPGDEIEIVSRFAPFGASGWEAIVRIRIE